jgi:hypothetical protein
MNFTGPNREVSSQPRVTHVSSRLPRQAWEQPTCLWQVEKEMALQTLHASEARKAARQTSHRLGLATVGTMSVKTLICRG